LNRQIIEFIAHINVNTWLTVINAEIRADRAAVLANSNYRKIHLPEYYLDETECDSDLYLFFCLCMRHSIVNVQKIVPNTHGPTLIVAGANAVSVWEKGFNKFIDRTESKVGARL
jgi:hypothetical protein